MPIIMCWKRSENLLITQLSNEQIHSLLNEILIDKRERGVADDEYFEDCKGMFTLKFMNIQSNALHYNLFIDFHVLPQSKAMCVGNFATFLHHWLTDSADKVTWLPPIYWLLINLEWVIFSFRVCSLISLCMWRKKHHVHHVWIEFVRSLVRSFLFLKFNCDGFFNFFRATCDKITWNVSIRVCISNCRRMSHFNKFLHVGKLLSSVCVDNVNDNYLALRFTVGFPGVTGNFVNKRKRKWSQIKVCYCALKIRNLRCQLIVMIKRKKL